MFRNILENALAACRDPVEITVVCSEADAEGPARVRIAVRDNGPGLNPEQRQRIFEPFFTTKTKGTGLGMAIAKRIVEAHGGRIAVGTGSAPGAEIAHYLAAGMPMTQPLRIVVADDEPDMRDYFKKILPRLGHIVVGAAENGKELVEQCRTLQPDLVITDIKMPDMDGIDAAMAIYQHRPIPVILVSAYHDPALIERAEADHIMGYLVKPIKQADLEPVIALAMRRFEQFQALQREASDLRQALEDRKVIERAKGVIDEKGRDGRTRRLSPLAEAGEREEPQTGRNRTDDRDCGGGSSAAVRTRQRENAEGVAP